MQDALEIMLAYANAFEETYVDDDWTRLAPYFAEDAVYAVRGGPMACEISGRDAIFRGLKKSLDGLDRRCDERSIELIDGPQVAATAGGAEVTLGWRVSYRYGDAPPANFTGRTVTTVADGVIIELRDEYIDSDLEGFVRWMCEYGEGLDVIYV